MDVEAAQISLNDLDVQLGRMSEEAGPRPFTEADIGCDDKTRFTLELEFMQCLANPKYLNWLAQNQYFEDPAFIQYLEYLNYWRQPEYVKYIKYPHCLFMLQMLQSDQFTKAIAAPAVADNIHTQQYYFWQHYRNNRIKEGTESEPEQQLSADADTAQ
eukprot:jgi/Chrzof1/6646/Cz19g04060.t1